MKIKTETYMPPNDVFWAEGYDPHDSDERMAFLEEIMSDGICPACCTEGCYVEPDGTCPHGNPSLLLALGLI